MKKILAPLFAATMLFGGFCADAQAQIITDSWSAAGGAWTPANQPDFVTASPGGGVLYTDQAIAAGHNNSTDNTGATWTSFIPASPPYAGTGLYDDYYYNVFSLPAVTLATTNVLAGAQTITFTLYTAGNTFNINTVSLDYGGIVAASGIQSTDLGPDPDYPANLYVYTWTWNVSALPTPGSFTLNWTTPSIHTPYFEAILTQTAVPEPSTYALLAAGLGLVGCYSYRKKSRT